MLATLSHLSCVSNGLPLLRNSRQEKEGGYAQTVPHEQNPP